MAAGSALAATALLLLCFTLGPFGPAPALSSQAGRVCCTRYNRKPVPFPLVKGFREQTVKENCHIEAVILYTVKNREICVTQEDEWVRKTLELLSVKLQRMSTGAEAASRRRRHSPPNDGSGSFFHPADADPFY